ncbi:nuclear factor interleukin-3-regulated protein-like [Mercenaria mercenaria]|uniref:nuclear factor interleukin-3-regulated protein-like n=1 Tax=Mercenaria mercenaria TaxID=6596 RepID=UPI00234E3C53|nr:nuclear factor interleukin-3-regulated protein-like [Mercenaria mercenaria]
MDRYTDSNQSKTAIYTIMTNSSHSKSDMSPTESVYLVKSSAAVQDYDDNSNAIVYFPRRRQKEYIPESKKDYAYWVKRLRNNDAARRSRQKKSNHSLALKKQLIEMTRENNQLQKELNLIKTKFGLSLDETFTGVEAEIKYREGHQPLHPASEYMTAYSQSEHRTRYPSTVQQSYVRGKNTSSDKAPYRQPFEAQSMYSCVSSSRVITDSNYIKYANIHSGTSSYSGHFDDPCPKYLKSTKKDSNPYDFLAEDHLRQSQSTVLPPYQVHFHTNILADPYEKSYSQPIKDIKPYSSNDACDWFYTDVQEEPLSLVKKRADPEDVSS